MITPFLKAIAREEGFGKPGARPTRTNNPGDIIWGDWARAHGAIGHEQPSGRFAVFPSVDAGFAAMRALLASPAVFKGGPDGKPQLVHGYLGATIAEVLYRWAPPSDGNNVSAYLEGVLQMTGLFADTLVSPNLIGADRVKEK